MAVVILQCRQLMVSSSIVFALFCLLPSEWVLLSQQQLPIGARVIL